MNNHSKPSFLYKSGETDYFALKMFLRQLAPAVVSAVILAISDVIDSVVIGQTMGVTGLAAIGLILPIFMVFCVIMHGFGIGGCIVFASLNAEGRDKEALSSFQGVFTLAMIMGFVVSVLGNVFIRPVMLVLGADPASAELYGAAISYAKIIITSAPIIFAAYILNYYLRNDDCEKLAAAIFAAGNVVDISLNFILVLYCRLGVKGAGYATVSGYSVICVLYLVIIAAKKTRLNFAGYAPDIRQAFRCFKLGFSSSITYIFNMLFLIVANNILIRMDGGAGVAALDVIQNFSFLVTYVYDAINKSAQPIISTYNGERNWAGKRWIYHFTMRGGVILGLAFTLFCLICPQLICYVFGIRQPAELAICETAIRVFSLAIIFFGSNTIASNYYISCMIERVTVLISTLRTCVILIPATVLFSFIGGWCFWFLYLLTESLTYMLFIVYRLFLARDIDKNNIGETDIFRRTLTDSAQELGPLLADIEEFCEVRGASPKQTYFVTMSVEELWSVIRLKAFGDSHGYMQITLVYMGNNAFELLIRDSAAKFNPFDLETRKANLQDEDFDMDAMGVLMIKNKAKDFHYRNYQGFNTLRVTI